MFRKCCRQNVLRVLNLGMNLWPIQFSLYRGLTGNDFEFLNLSNASIDRLRVPKYHCNAPGILFSCTDSYEEPFSLLRLA